MAHNNEGKQREVNATEQEYDAMDSTSRGKSKNKRGYHHYVDKWLHAGRREKLQKDIVTIKRSLQKLELIWLNEISATEGLPNLETLLEFRKRYEKMMELGRELRAVGADVAKEKEIIVRLEMELFTYLEQEPLS